MITDLEISDPQLVQNQPPEHLNSKVSPTTDEIYTAKASQHSLKEESAKVVHDTFLSVKDSVPSAGVEYRVLTRRWYILLLFCLFTVSQVSVWNTFGPISATSRRVFGWEEGTIALLNDLGPIAYVISGIFFSWLLNVKGLRAACLLSSSMVAMGTLLRCITLENPAATYLVIMGHFLNGLGGPMSNSGAPKLSALWFPLDQRATATTIGAMALYLGLSISFILGPFVVPEIHSHCREMNTTGDSPLIVCSDSKSANTDSEDFINEQKKMVRLLMIGEATFATSVLVLMVIYFPSHPPVPPSPTSAVDRVDFLQGTKDLLSHKQVVTMALIYALVVGGVNVWSSFLHLNLSTHDVSEQTAGKIGFYATISAMCFALTLARFVDKYLRVMKYLVIVLFTLGGILFLVFTLAYGEVLPATQALFYLTIITGKTCLESTSPILFELSCELAYPVGEGMTTILLTYANNILALFFLSAVSVPGVGIKWINWYLVSAIALSIPLLVITPLRFTRRDIDQQQMTPVAASALTS